MFWSLSPPPSRILNLQLSFSLLSIITSFFLSTGSFSSAQTPAQVASTFKTSTLMSTTSLDLVLLQLQTYLPSLLPSKPSQKNDLYLLSSLLLLFHSSTLSGTWLPQHCSHQGHRQCLYFPVQWSISNLSPTFQLHLKSLTLSSFLKMFLLTSLASYSPGSIPTRLNPSVSFADLSPPPDDRRLGCQKLRPGHFLNPLF